MYELYVATNTGDIDQLKLGQIEAGSDKEKLKTYYGVSPLKARVMLHQDLTDYLKNREADKAE